MPDIHCLSVPPGVEPLFAPMKAQRRAYDAGIRDGSGMSQASQNWVNRVRPAPYELRVLIARAPMIERRAVSASSGGSSAARRASDASPKGVRHTNRRSAAATWGLKALWVISRPLAGLRGFVLKR